VKLEICNLQAEENLLSTLIQTDSFDNLIEPLEKEHFYLHDHNRIFEAIQLLALKNKKYDLVALQDVFKNSVSAAFFMNLIDGIPSRTKLNHFASIIISKARVRKVASVCVDVLDKCHNSDFTDDIILADVEDALFCHEKHNVGFVKASDVAPLVIDEIIAKSETTDGIAGIRTGFDRYDMNIGGLCPSDLVIIAGRPSHGKTAIAVNIATYQASKGHHVGIISLEMSKEQLVMRMLSSLTRIPVTSMRTGRVTEDEIDRMKEAYSSLACVHVDDRPAQHINQIKSSARRLYRKHNISCLYVDYMQLARGNSKSNREREISEISAGMKAIAKELNIPVVCLSQLSRKCEAREDKRPMMSDLRDSGSIEQDADVIAFVYRHEQYSDKDEHRGKAELLVEKNRQGATGVIHLDFHGETTTFKNQITMHEVVR